MKRTNTAVWFEKYSRWQINVQKDGKRRSFTSSAPGRTGQREANAKADAWLDEGLEGTSVKAGALLGEYLDNLKITTSTSNWMQQESIGRQWILPAISTKAIGKVNEAHYQSVLNKAYAAGRSKKTLMNIRACILGFAKYCRKRKASTYHPEDLTLPRGARKNEKRILQPQEIQTLFSIDTTILNAKTEFEPYINAFRYQLLTGIRPGELAGLRWNNCHSDYADITRAINYLGEETAGKNENALRRVYHTQLAKEVVEAQRKMTGTQESVFCISSQHHYSERLKRYCISNGINHITPYELRHTFVSLAKNLGEGRVRQMIGHSANMDTFGTYGHELQGEMEEAAKELNRIIESVLARAKCV